MKILIISFVLLYGCGSIQDIDVNPTTTIVKKLVLPKGK